MFMYVKSCSHFQKKKFSKYCNCNGIEKVIFKENLQFYKK